MNFDVIPTASELHHVTIDAERAKRQEKRIKVISTQLSKANGLGLHELTLYQNYMIQTYSLDVEMLKKVFEEKGYDVASTKDGFGFTVSIVIRW